MFSRKIISGEHLYDLNILPKYIAYLLNRRWSPDMGE